MEMGIDWSLIRLAFTPYMLWICLLGTTLGILWGAMPGLSTTMAMALLIGLSAGMDQYPALMFMLGVYTGSVFGGAISARTLRWRCCRATSPLSRRLRRRAQT